MGRTIFYRVDGFWIQTAAVYVALLSVFAAYDSVFDLEIRFGIVAAALLGVILVLELLLRSENHLGWKIMVILLIPGISAFIFRESALTGMASFVNAYIEKRNEFYQIRQPGMEVSAVLTDDLMVLIGIQVLLGMILIMVQKMQKGGIFALLVMLIPLILAATVGYMPSTPASWGLLSAGSLYLIVYHRSSGRFPVREIAAAAGTLLILYLCTLLIQPKITEYKEAHQQEYKKIRLDMIEFQNEHLQVENILREHFKLQESSASDLTEDSISDGAENYVTGGIGSGNLDQLAKIQPKGTEELTITVSERPESRIYLKAYVGTTYTGTEWEELEAFDFSRLMSPFGTNTKRRELMNEPFSRIENSSNEPKSEFMQIELLEASKKYGYSPYYAEILEEEDIKLDAYVKGNSSRSREYHYYPREFAEAFSDSELAEASGLWNSYIAFVEDTYVEYPERLEQLSGLCTNLDTSSIEHVSEGIDEYFFSNLRYSKEPGAKSSDQDFVEYFLFENQKGFCVHFASAATLMYRECGYPARYVEGYAVSPGDFKRQGNGTYQAVVTDEMAHAWCETFDPGTGWRVREHTLPYKEDEGYHAGMTEPETDDPETEELETELQEDPEKEESSGNTSEDSDESLQEPDIGTDLSEDQTNPAEESEDSQQSGSTWKGFLSKLIKAIGSVLLMLVLVCLICFIQQKIRRQKKFYRFRIRKDNLGIAAIYSEIYEICRMLGMSAADQSDRKAAKEMQEKFPQLTKEEWEWLYECATRAAFSSEMIEKEERKRFYELYRKFRKEVLKELKGWKKFQFLYLKGM